MAIVIKLTKMDDAIKKTTSLKLQDAKLSIFLKRHDRYLYISIEA